MGKSKQWTCCWLPLRVIIIVLVGAGLAQRSSSSLGAVSFLNAPETPASSHSLRLHFSCAGPAVVHLELLLYLDTGAELVLLRRRWRCGAGERGIRRVALRFPDWLVYRPDWSIPHSHWVSSCLLRGWVSSGSSAQPVRFSLSNAVAQISVVSPLSRPLKQHLLCPSWDAEMRWRFIRTEPQCPEESEVVRLLPTLYGSSGENFGIIKTLRPYMNEMLEVLRLKALTYPWCSFSLWVLVERPCRERMCGLLYHIDSQENYDTPTVFLNRAGQIHVQLQDENGLSSAFLSTFTLPLGQWCLLNLELTGRMGKVTAACIDRNEQPLVLSSEHMFLKVGKLDDTDGYFVVGGSKFIRGIEGFYGPATYYRSQISSLNVHELQLPLPLQKVNLSGWLQSCLEFKLKLDQEISDCSHEIAAKRLSGNCLDIYTELRLKNSQGYSRAQCSHLKSLNNPQRRLVFNLVKLMSNKYGSVDPAVVGRTLYSLVLKKLVKGGSVEVISKLMSSLLQAGCLGDNRALHLSSVLYSSGLGVQKQPYKAWLLSLLAAQKDWRLALLRLGHLHRVGDQIVPPDPDLSFAYYSNIAKQTSVDRLNPSSQQTFVESVFLNDEETLKAQTSANHDIFQWLKLQARNGVAEAEQAIGRMLFWGQQGVTPDIQTAVRHYERGAVRLQDPVSMYDYAVVLLMGQGVPKDVPRAVTFLKKAAEQGFAPAITALGWYYEQFERDYKRAAELWEQADHLGNPDAAMNLGVLYSQGLYPGQAADKVKAFKYFFKSAQRGHINGGIQLAEIWSQGIPGHVARRPSDAVLWMKWASEQNGYLGAVLRKGLNAYLKGNWFMAVIYYLMSAECGFEAAQFNMAFLCEHSPGGSLSAAFVTECMLRFYNLSLQSQDPAPYALVKMGDLFYEEHARGRRDLSDAVEMYKRAALKNNPQGWYSLGLLVQEGQRIPPTLLSQLNLLQHYFSDKHTLLTALYHRCRDSNSDDAYLPCTLALLATHLHSIKTLGYITVQLLSAVAVAVATVSLFKVIPAVLRQRSTSHRESSPPSGDRQPPDEEETTGL